MDCLDEETACIVGVFGAMTWLPIPIEPFRLEFAEHIIMLVIGHFGTLALYPLTELTVVCGMACVVAMLVVGVFFEPYFDTLTSRIGVINTRGRAIVLVLECLVARGRAQGAIYLVVVAHFGTIASLVVGIGCSLIDVAGCMGGDHAVAEQSDGLLCHGGRAGQQGG